MSDEKTLFEFPCEFGVKAMGLATDEFSIAVLEIVRKHIEGELQEDAISLKVSGAGKYHSLTVRITATSKAQLDAIYQDLTDHPDVLMAI